MGGKRAFRLSFNAPAVLSFALICLGAQILNVITGGGSNGAVFSVYRSSLLDPLTYVRAVCHVFGHADWGHLINNMMYLLILGPMLEEKYGSSNIAFVMLVTAVVTGVLHMAFFGAGVRLLGASGVVFAFILLSSITSSRENAIPVTFLLVAALFIGQQIWQGVTEGGNVSYLTHIAGGVVGSVLGFMMNRSRPGRYKR